MSEDTNTYSLQSIISPIEDDDRNVAIGIDHVSMVFNMASEQLNNLKEYFIALMRHELRFKEFRALDNITLEVKEGDVFGILGTNGSGKSTLLKIIAGVLDPSEGSCTVTGSIAPLIELGAGFDMDLTARENIYLNGALLGYSKHFIDQHFDEIVEFAEIEDFLDMPLKNYSSGMVARIAFAIATVIVPEILIVDEVLSVGDFMFQKKCEDRIATLINEHNVTVLIVSHNNDQIERLCNKAAWIEKGHLRMAGPAKEVCEIYRVLGGHSGTKQSEEKVVETLTCHSRIQNDSFNTIEADNRYGIAAKLASACFEERANSVVLSSGDREMDCHIAQAFSSCVDAPLLFFQEGSIPDSTLQKLSSLSPKRIFILTSEENGRSTVNTISSILSTSIPSLASIESIAKEGLTELSIAAYEAGQKWGKWGDSLLISYDFCIGDLIALSPYYCFTRTPLLIHSRNDVSFLAKVSDLTFSPKLQQILVIEDDHGLSNEELLSTFSPKATVHRFWSNGLFNANRKINDWIETHSQSWNVVSRLIIAHSPELADSLAVGQYAARTRSLVLLEDPQNLDSVAHAIEYVEKKHGDVKQITFIGSRTRFGSTDKTLLARAVSRFKANSASLDNETLHETDPQVH